VNVLGVLRIRILSPWVAMVLVLAVVVGIVAQADAQTSRYTLDDVMDKLIEVDKRLAVVETEVRRNRELIETVHKSLTKQIETVHTNLGARINDTNARIDDTNARIESTNTTMRWVFGLLGTLFLGILGVTLATYKNTASLVKPPDRSGVKEAEVLETLRKEVREIVAQEERALEEKLQAADRSVPKLLEALEEKVSALAERQKELERKLAPAEAV